MNRQLCTLVYHNISAQVRSISSPQLKKKTKIIAYYPCLNVL